LSRDNAIIFADAGDTRTVHGCLTYLSTSELIQWCRLSARLLLFAAGLAVN
jgi:hypothetical protein